MNSLHLNRQALRGLLPGLTLGLAMLASVSMSRAEEAKGEAEKVAAPAVALPEEAPAAELPPLPEPERVSGEIYKVDVEGKVITILVPPDRDKTGRAFTRLKLVLDDKSLIMIDQQPSAITALEAGQLVEVGYFKKGKDKVLDTVVVVGKKPQ